MSFDSGQLEGPSQFLPAITPPKMTLPAAVVSVLEGMMLDILGPDGRNAVRALRRPSKVAASGLPRPVTIPRG